MEKNDDLFWGDQERNKRAAEIRKRNKYKNKEKEVK
jgi:hypothetical protein